MHKFKYIDNFFDIQNISLDCEDIVSLKHNLQFSTQCIPNINNY